MTTTRSFSLCGRWHQVLLLVTMSWLVLLFPSHHHSVTVSGLSVQDLHDDDVWNYETRAGHDDYAQQRDGLAHYQQGKHLFQQEEYDEASLQFWMSILFHGDSPKYEVTDAFNEFMQCYLTQHKAAEGLAFVSKESFRRGQLSMGKSYLDQAKSMDPHNYKVKWVLREYGEMADMETDDYDYKNENDKEIDDDDEDDYAHSAPKKKSSSATTTKKVMGKEDKDLQGKTPEELYGIASAAFSSKNYEECADVFELSCRKSQYKLGPSCSNAVYCRTALLDWGFNGTQFNKDMARLTKLIKKETAQFLKEVPIKNSGGRTVKQWQRASSVHPHMTLGFPINATLKRLVTESVASLDEKMARLKENGVVKPLPDDLPYDHLAVWEEYKEEAETHNYKIRVAFIGSGFNSKAVLYLSNDMFRFFDQSKFEVHVFSVNDPDNERFIQVAMNGVDWRQRVIDEVDYFHDVRDIKHDHVKLARFIRKKKIHILIEWDGYARQGERAQGLFTLKPAPIQILHQEYLGTSGAEGVVDYLFTDINTSPVSTQHLYTEKLIYLPNHFFSKGHAVQDEVHPPSYKYKQISSKSSYHYVKGKGSPQRNKCMAGSQLKEDPSFVYCNYNKFLKNNPETVRSWIRILREVPGSILCLLENPEAGVDYFRKFVHEASGTTGYDQESGTETYLPGDGEDINNRIFFLGWEKNPFDHQRRSFDFCNAMLDSYPYNAHTVAQDALYAGVPIVTRSDGEDMCSRVSTSANIIIYDDDDDKLSDQLNAYNGPSHYEDLAISLGNDKAKFKTIRNKLIGTCLQENPMHRYWDVSRYVHNFGTALSTVWQKFLSGENPEHVFVYEKEEETRSDPGEKDNNEDGNNDENSSNEEENEDDYDLNEKEHLLSSYSQTEDSPKASIDHDEL